jgi:CRISPR type IV-associated protein Csf3
MSDARRLARMWAKEPLSRLMIVAELGAPVATGPTPWGRWHLDGMIAWALMDMLDRCMPRHPGAVCYPPLPLASITGPDGRSVWAASQLAPAGLSVEGLTRWRRRPDLEAALEWLAARRLPRSVGARRARDDYLTVVTCTSLMGIAVGHAEWIERLLSRITHIGKKHSQGYGRVRRWDVRALPGDPIPSWALVDTEGTVIRPMPVAIAQDIDAAGRVVHGGWRPPYWLREDWTEIVVQ